MKCTSAILALLVSSGVALQKTRPVAHENVAAIDFAYVGCPVDSHPFNRLLQTNGHVVPGTVQFDSMSLDIAWKAENQAHQKALHWALHWGCVSACGPHPINSMCVTECEVDMYQCIDKGDAGDSKMHVDKCQNAVLEKVAKENGVTRKDAIKKKKAGKEDFYEDDFVHDDRGSGPLPSHPVKKEQPQKADVLKQFDEHVKSVVDSVAEQLDKFGKKADVEVNKKPIVTGSKDFGDAQKTFGEKHVEKIVAPKPIVKEVKQEDSFGKQIVVEPKKEDKKVVAEIKKEVVKPKPAAPIAKEVKAEPESFGKEAERKMQSIVKSVKDAVQSPFGKAVAVEKVKGPLPPLADFMPSCLAHLEQLIRMVDRSYTDNNLQTVLENECLLEKDFPSSCDSGFERHTHCHDFAAQLHKARWLELDTGSDEGYKQACKDYYNLRMGITKPKPKQVMVTNSAPVHWFDSHSMPKVSPTMQCIIALTFQYFALFTLLTIVRTLNSFRYNLVGVQKILETACTTVTYAPMLCVLFLGARMRAIQLTQGETEKYQLPQPWVQTSMVVTSTAVVAQVVLVVLVGILSGMNNVRTDEEGNLDVSRIPDLHPTAVQVLTVFRYIVMAMLYGGFTVVVIGVFTMKGPKEIWGDEELPVSPAVMCTIVLSATFFGIYLLVAITKTLFEVSTRSRHSATLLKLEASATAAKMTVNFAPMLCVLFIGARMRALQIDPKHGNPQPWAQNCFYLCTFSVLIQALLVILVPFVAKGDCRRGEVEGDLSFSMESPIIGAVMTVLRYLCLVALYVGIVTVIYSVFVIQHPEGPAKTPPVSATMQCVINLATQYFLIYTLIFICSSIKSAAMGQAASTNDAEQQSAMRFHSESRFTAPMTRAIAIFDAARSTVMFAPMLAILFIGARMRSLQLMTLKDGTIPATAGPQKWVQDGMFLATWAVFIQLIMAMLVPLLTSAKPECDQDGNTKVPRGTNKYLAITVEVIRYICMVFMYGGAVIVVVGICTMTPESLNSNANLVPGAAVPNPPLPASSAPAALPKL